MLLRCQRGAVYVEFLVVIVPLFLFFLIIMQTALIYVGNLVVRHTAGSVARGAVVILDDDPARYEGQARRSLAADGCSEGSTGNILAGFLESSSDSGSGDVGDDGSCDGGARAGAIRAHAVASMIAVSPPLQHLFRRSEGAPGRVTGLAGRVLYAMGATSVTFPTEPGSSVQRQSWGAGDPVTVRVTYLQYCGIPMASLLMCDRLLSLTTGLDIDTGRRRTWKQRMEVQRRLRDARPALRDLNRGAPNQFVTWALLASGARFKLLQAEATLPMQGANYQYRSEQ